MEADDEAHPESVAADRLKLEQARELTAQGGAQLRERAVEECRVRDAASEPVQLLTGAPAGLDVDELEAIGGPGDAHAGLEIRGHRAMVRPAGSEVADTPHARVGPATIRSAARAWLKR